MIITSWNVNGIRAGLKKDTLKQIFNQNINNEQKKTKIIKQVDFIDSDIIALQETKCTIDQLTNEQLNYYGYESVFESARNRKGYSGVAVYVKPDINFKLLHPTLNKKDFYDEEGRTLVVEFDNFYLINCYFPNGGKSDEHYVYKLEYYEHFLKLAQKLEKKKPVIWCGDVNATNTDNDLARPKENKDKLGCTEPERKALKKFTENFVDTFRLINGDKIQYTWWDMKTRSREKNVGWRIDYFYTSKSLENKIIKSEIRNDVYGSDHCPIVLEINI